MNHRENEIEPIEKVTILINLLSDTAANIKDLKA